MSPFTLNSPGSHVQVTHGVDLRHFRLWSRAASRDTKKKKKKTTRRSGATMGDIPLYLSNVNVSIGQTMAVEQVGEQPSL